MKTTPRRKLSMTKLYIQYRYEYDIDEYDKMDDRISEDMKSSKQNDNTKQ